MGDETIPTVWAHLRMVQAAFCGNSEKLSATIQKERDAAIRADERARCEAEQVSAGVKERIAARLKELLSVSREQIDAEAMAGVAEARLEGARLALEAADSEYRRIELLTDPDRLRALVAPEEKP